MDGLDGQFMTELLWVGLQLQRPGVARCGVEQSRIWRRAESVHRSFVPEAEGRRCIPVATHVRAMPVGGERLDDQLHP